jgi:hypothetical protein
LINPFSEANFVIAFFATVGMCGRFIGVDFIQKYLWIGKNIDDK